MAAVIRYARLSHDDENNVTLEYLSEFQEQIQAVELGTSEDWRTLVGMLGSQGFSMCGVTNGGLFGSSMFFEMSWPLQYSTLEAATRAHLDHLKRLGLENLR